MSKQLKLEQSLVLFNICEIIGTKALWFKYTIYQEIKKNTINIFINFIFFIIHSSKSYLFMNTFILKLFASVLVWESKINFNPN